MDQSIEPNTKYVDENIQQTNDNDLLTSETRKETKTSRDRPKSASYPKLKNCKKTSKCQGFSCTVLENQKFFEKITYSKKWTEWRAGVNIFVNILSTFLSHLKGDPLERKKFYEEKSHNAEKLKEGPFGVFQHPFCRKTSKN